MLRNSLPKIVTGSLPGPKASEIIKTRDKVMPKAIKCIYPCVIKRGEGAMFEDVDGNIFLDWVGGVGVLNIGYTHPELVEAVKEQADKYFHAMMNITTHENYIKLAGKMNDIVPVRGDEKQTMFANSGAEANENAVKIAKGYTKRHNIIVFNGAFHGRTQMTMAMTGNKAYSVGMGPFPAGIHRVEFPDMYRAPKGFTEEEAIAFYLEKLEHAFVEACPAENVAAIVFEPVQGEGGFIPAPISWVKALRQICDKYGILMVTDEVQSGWGRSGKMFVSQYFKDAGCAPDIMTTAKSIAGGLPLSAVTASKEIMDGVPGGTIGGTYCGNPVACASALKVVDIMQKENYPQKALDIGKKVTERFKAIAKKYDVIGDVRGVGAMLGVEFVKNQKTKEPYPEIVGKMVAKTVQKGLLIEGAGTYGNVIRFLCPLCVTDEQLEKGLDIFEESLKECLA